MALHNILPVRRETLSAIGRASNSTGRRISCRATLRFLLIVALIVGAFSATASFGANSFNWNNASGGDFSISTNWSPSSPSGPPVAGDTAVFSLGGAYTVTGNGLASIIQVSGGDVTFAGSVGTDSQSSGAAVYMSSATVRVSGSLGTPLPLLVGEDKSGGAGTATLRVFGGGSVQATRFSRYHFGGHRRWPSFGFYWESVHSGCWFPSDCHRRHEHWGRWHWTS